MGVKAVLASAGAFLGALVASSHHGLHMILLSVGLGGSSVFFSPGLRRTMLVVSLAMTLLTAWWILRRPRGRVESLAAGLGVGASLVLLANTVIQHGL